MTVLSLPGMINPSIGCSKSRFCRISKLLPQFLQNHAVLCKCTLQCQNSIRITYHAPPSAGRSPAR